MKVDWKWRIVLIVADGLEHCAASPVFTWTLLLQWDRTRHGTHSWETASVGKVTGMTELQSWSEVCWNRWCLSCLVRRFHSVKRRLWTPTCWDRWQGCIWRRVLFFSLWFYVHTVTVQKERFRQDVVKPLVDVCQRHSIDCFPHVYSDAHHIWSARQICL